MHAKSASELKSHRSCPITPAAELNHTRRLRRLQGTKFAQLLLDECLPMACDMSHQDGDHAHLFCIDHVRFCIRAHDVNLQATACTPMLVVHWRFNHVQFSHARQATRKPVLAQ